MKNYRNKTEIIKNFTKNLVKNRDLIVLKTWFK